MTINNSSTSTTDNPLSPSIERRREVVDATITSPTGQHSGGNQRTTTSVSDNDNTPETSRERTIFHRDEELYVKEKIKTFTRKVVFEQYKFLTLPHDKLLVETVAKQSARNYFNQGIIPRGFDLTSEYWSGTIGSELATCRHNAQTLARKNYKGR